MTECMHHRPTCGNHDVGELVLACIEGRGRCFDVRIEVKNGVQASHLQRLCNHAVRAGKFQITALAPCAMTESKQGCKAVARNGVHAAAVDDQPRHALADELFDNDQEVIRIGSIKPTLALNDVDIAFEFKGRDFHVRSVLDQPAGPDSRTTMAAYRRCLAGGAPAAAACAMSMARRPSPS